MRFRGRATFRLIHRKVLITTRHYFQFLSYYLLGPRMYSFVHCTSVSKRISIAGNIRRAKQWSELWREKRSDMRGCFTAMLYRES